MFGPSGIPPLLWPRLTSPRPSQRLSTSVALGSRVDLPGYCAPTFTLMPVGYTPHRSVQVSGFGHFRCLTPMRRLVSASCSSGQRFASGFLRIRSRPQHPCLWLTLPLVGRVEDFHPQVGAPCRAHENKNGRPTGRPFYLTCRPVFDQTEAMSPMAIAFTTACTLFVAFSFSKTLLT